MNTPSDAPGSAPGLRTKSDRPVSTSTAPVLGVLMALSFSHLLNDAMQSLVPSLYPILKDALHLNFAHIGLITLTNQLTASVLQPFVGLYTDRRPQPFSLAVGMTFTLVGLLFLSFASSLTLVLIAVALVGIGSSIFHPEASRIALLASGGRLGFAQSLFQVGGNAGSALGPLLAALIVVARGQSSVMWFSLLAVTGIALLTGIGRWYRAHLTEKRKPASAYRHQGQTLTRGRVVTSLAILIALIFSKYFYLASMSSYYTFFLIGKFGLTVKSAQLHLFVFLFAVAAGTLLGGPLGDRFGRKSVIWVSILGAAPFALALPYANLLLGRNSNCDHRPYSGLSLFGHTGLCTGTGSGQDRDDCRTLLWSRFRIRRYRFCRVRRFGRSHQHRVRLPVVFVPSPHRSTDLASTEFGAKSSDILNKTPRNRGAISR